MAIKWLHDEWKLLVKHAWSVRLILLAGLLSAAEVLFSFYPDVLPPLPYSGVSALLSIAALVARVSAQKRFMREVNDVV